VSLLLPIISPPPNTDYSTRVGGVNKYVTTRIVAYLTSQTGRL